MSQVIRYQQDTKWKGNFTTNLHRKISASQRIYFYQMHCGMKLTVYESQTAISYLKQTKIGHQLT